MCSTNRRDLPHSTPFHLKWGWIACYRMRSESIATLPPSDPMEGHKCFFRLPANESLRRTGLHLSLSAKIQFLPSCIWELPFMSHRYRLRRVIVKSDIRSHIPCFSLNTVSGDVALTLPHCAGGSLREESWRKTSAGSPWHRNRSNRSKKFLY